MLIKLLHQVKLYQTVFESQYGKSCPAKTDNFFRNNDDGKLIDVTIGCHQEGHGTENCLEKLVLDLSNNNFKPIIVRQV